MHGLEVVAPNAFLEESDDDGVAIMNEMHGAHFLWERQRGVMKRNFAM